MLDAKEIDIEIARLEYGESSYPAYQKLANLYTIRNQMRDKENSDNLYDRSYSAAPATMLAADANETYGDSDFLRAVVNKNPADVWKIIDDLMDTLRVVNRKAYDSVMNKIMNL